MKLRVLLLLTGTLALSACSDSYDSQILGTLERDRLELIAESNEPIVEISVREGDAVAAGAPLLRQELGSMQARLDQAIAARNVAQHRETWAVMRERLRLVRHSPDTAPVFEMRMPDRDWTPLAWDASAGRFALDVWQDIAVHRRTLWTATPAGLVSRDGNCTPFTS